MRACVRACVRLCVLRALRQLETVCAWRVVLLWEPRYGSVCVVCDARLGSQQGVHRIEESAAVAFAAFAALNDDGVVPAPALSAARYSDPDAPRLPALYAGSLLDTKDSEFAGFGEAPAAAAGRPRSRAGSTVGGGAGGPRGSVVALSGALAASPPARGRPAGGRPKSGVTGADGLRLRRLSRDVIRTMMPHRSFSRTVIDAENAVIDAARTLRDLLGPVVKTYGPGMAFGELALSSSADGMRRATAVARSDGSGRRACLLYLSRECYQDTFQRHVDEEWAQKLALLSRMGVADVPKRVLTKLAYAMARESAVGGGPRAPPLFRAGDAVDGVYFVESGAVRLRLRSGSSAPSTPGHGGRASAPPPAGSSSSPRHSACARLAPLRDVVTAGPGFHVGEIEVLAGERVRRSTAEPIGREGVVFFVVPPSAFMEFVAEAPACAFVTALRASAAVHEASVARLEAAIATAGGGRRWAPEHAMIVEHAPVAGPEVGWAAADTVARHGAQSSPRYSRAVTVNHIDSVWEGDDGGPSPPKSHAVASLLCDMVRSRVGS